MDPRVGAGAGPPGHGAGAVGGRGRPARGGAPRRGGPEDADAAAFAAAHRLRGLKLGLGQDPAAPDGLLLGLPGQRAVAVSRFGYEVWLWGQRTPTLWSACERIAQARAAEVLPELIESLHPLLAAAVAYLDIADDPVSGDAY